MDKYDIITFGSASKDLFLFSKEFSKKNFCFAIDDKIEADDIIIHSGGGGTNVATTFSLQGLKTAYYGSVGKDYAGFSILLDLKRFGISTEFLNSLKNKTTNHSVILSQKEKGKTILVYRGASNYLPENFDLKKLKTDWFYLAPLGGQYSKKVREIITFAKFHKIKIALNPSKTQIKELKKDIKNWLPNIDVILPNEREAKMLFGDYKKPEELFKKIKPYLKGVLVTADGEESIAFDGKNIYRAKGLKAKIADKTGAGDAFSSGFVSGLIKTDNIVEALQLASANSANCVQKWGAKEGLLKKDDKYTKVKVIKTKLK